MPEDGKKCDFSPDRNKLFQFMLGMQDRKKGSLDQAVSEGHKMIPLAMPTGTLSTQCGPSHHTPLGFNVELLNVLLP